MSDKKIVVVKRGAPLSTLLLVLFIGLKLTGFITWSWFWVLSPFWMPLALLLGGLMFFGLFALIIAIASSR